MNADPNEFDSIGALGRVCVGQQLDFHSFTIPSYPPTSLIYDPAIMSLFRLNSRQGCRDVKINQFDAKHPPPSSDPPERVHRFPSFRWDKMIGASNDAIVGDRQEKHNRIRAAAPWPRHEGRKATKRFGNPVLMRIVCSWRDDDDSMIGC